MRFGSLRFILEIGLALTGHHTDDVYKQFAQLRRIGGDTVKETVKLLMNRLMNNYVMSFISLDGRSYGKLPRILSLCAKLSSVSIGRCLF